MDTNAIVLEKPESLALRRLELVLAGDDDVMVDIDWTGISTGTERLLWSGRMPSFPGMGYPLVPGYESVGRVRAAGAGANLAPGTRVFVPGAACYKEARGLFGGAARRLIVPAARVTPIGDDLGDQGVLLALAATAYHALAGSDRTPDLIVGHGVLGRLLARIAIAMGGDAPTVWETAIDRHPGARGYTVVSPDQDDRRDYQMIVDASGAAQILDLLIGRMARGGEIVLAGFYEAPVSFVFPPAFMKEARFRVAAEFKPVDLIATRTLVENRRLSLDGLITHYSTPDQAQDAYQTAFTDPSCLKMVLDWRTTP